MKEKEGKKFDMHGHTNHHGLFFESFLEPISYSIPEAIRKAKEVELGGIALTCHDTVQELHQALDLAAKEGIILVPGVEITSHEGRRFPHILGLGITPDAVDKSRYHNPIFPFGKISKIPYLAKPETVIEWIHDLGGLAIAAHPTPPKHRRELGAMSHTQVQKYAQKDKNRLDGIETVSLYGTSEYFTSLAQKYNLAALGSSDFHFLKQIGLAGTKVFGNPQKWEDIIEAIRERNIEAFITPEIPNELKGKRSENGFRNMVLRRM